MEFQYKGANCIIISTKAASLITDPNISMAGLKNPNLSKVGLSLLTDPRFAQQGAEGFSIDCPGEYEVKGFAIRGIAARAHMDEAGKPHTSTVYRVSANELNIVIIGHIYPELSDEQLESIGVVDVMIVPVGGNGYTLDAAGAAKIVRAISPKVVIPTHFADEGVAYEVPQNALDDFLKELGAPYEQQDKLKIKKDALSDALKVVELRRS